MAERDGIQGGGGERPPVSGAGDQIWSREPPLGLKHLFWKTQPSRVQDGAGRRGWDRRSNDPYHPLLGPVSTRMPMKTSQRRRARSAAPRCDPCLPVSMPTPSLSLQGSAGRGLPSPPPCLSHPPAKVHSQTVSRLRLSCGLEVLGGLLPNSFQKTLLKKTISSAPPILPRISLP